AEELHDNVCQILGVSKLYLSELILNKENTDGFLNEADKLISKALEEIRQLSYNMKPPSFENMTLTESVEMLVSNISRVKKFGFSLDSSDFKEQHVSDDHKILIYRIIQEQLNNIVKYAEAPEVGARLSIDENNRVRVTVRDNGRGFDPGKVKCGIGLRNIESRIQAHKGRMKIESSPGKGCTLSASFSL
ncbi:MAG: sensor histidine kinase, partial [Bacteroidota bacterium]